MYGLLACKQKETIVIDGFLTFDIARQIFIVCYHLRTGNDQRKNFLFVLTKGIMVLNKRCGIA
jgi:hypothetical protein